MSASKSRSACANNQQQIKRAFILPGEVLTAQNKACAHLRQSISTLALGFYADKADGFRWKSYLLPHQSIKVTSANDTNKKATRRVALAVQKQAYSPWTAAAFSWAASTRRSRLTVTTGAERPWPRRGAEPHCDHPQQPVCYRMRHGAADAAHGGREALYAQAGPMPLAMASRVSRDGSKPATACLSMVCLIRRSCHP